MALDKLGLIKLKPVEIKSLQTFLDSCVEQVSKDGINIIGLQGGYVNLPEDEMPTSPFTPLQANLEIIPGSDLKVPLWFRERGNGVQQLNVPSKSDIEKELNNYVNKRFVLCLNNLSSFAEQGFVMEADAIPDTKSKIWDDKVIVTVEYPIRVSKEATEFNLEKYSASVDSKLGELYEAAKEIITKENQDTFLENRTIAALIAYDPEVPFSGVDLSCSEKTWFKPEVIAKLKNILFENTAAITVKGTNAKTKDSLKYLQFDALENSRNNIDINFMYIPNWPTVVEINPSEGNILRNNPIGKRSGGGVQAIVSSFVCIGDHRFVYDIKYPVLVTIRDSSGLIFQFATEVIIDNNKPRVNRQEILDLPDVDNEICKYPQRDLIIGTGTFSDNSELKSLSDVDLSFKCFPANCDLGTSRSDQKGRPVLITKVPLCVNGVVEGRKENYFPGKAFFSSNEEEDNQVLITLEPKYKKKVKVFVIDKETGDVREPYDTEQIGFQFIHKTLTFTTSYNYPEDEEVELLVGDYKINSYLIRNSTWPITTKKETIENCIDTRAAGLMSFFKKETHCEKMEIEPMELDYAMTGGAIFENTFERRELASDGELNLYILSDPVPSDLDAMQRVQLALEINSEHPLFRYPEVS